MPSIILGLLLSQGLLAEDPRKPVRSVASAPRSDLRRTAAGDARFHQGHRAAYRQGRLETADRQLLGRRILSTGGNLVFQGDEDGYLNVHAADTGTLLKRLDVGTSIMAAPMTYRVAGVQYVSVMAGYGGGVPYLPLPKTSAAAGDLAYFFGPYVQGAAAAEARRARRVPGNLAALRPALAHRARCQCRRRAGAAGDATLSRLGAS